MTTEFQRKLIKDKETLWAIVKLFHPDMPEKTPTKNGELDIKEVRLSAYSKYDWVCISFRVRDYGHIDIGLSNCHQTELFGPRITMKQMQTALANGTCKFHVWRFAMDKLFDTGGPEKEAIEILKKAGYSLQSAHEMHKIYYED